MGENQRYAGAAFPIKIGELQTIDDLQREAVEAQLAAQNVESELTILADWIADLHDRYAAAPFGTAGLARGVVGVVEATPAPTVAHALVEAIDGLFHEIDETVPFTEAAEALNAKRQIGGFGSK